MAKFIKTPFATAGDKTTIPDAADPSGFVSWEEGYPLDYSRPYDSDPLAKPIERLKLNQALYDISSGVQQYQTHGVPDFITAADNGGVPYPYSYGARVIWTDGKIYINQVSGNTNDPVSGGWIPENTNQNGAFKNKIINGNFDFWQRATSQTSNGYGSDDRFSNLNIGSTKVHSRQLFTIGQTDVPGSPRYFSRTVVTSVAGPSNLVLKYQPIERVDTLSGTRATLSFWAKVDAAKNISIELVQNFGTGGTPSTRVTGIGTTKIPLTTSWEKIIVTVDIPSISGKTLGTNNDDQLQVLFWFDAGADYNIRTDSLGQQSGTFDIAQVQIEEGNVATSFENRALAAEEALCYRYFEKLKVENTNGALCNASVYTATSVQGVVLFTAVKRSVPTISLSAPSTFAIFSNGASVTPSAVTSTASTNKSFRLSSTVAALTSGHSAWVEFVSGGGGYISIDSEL